ncbi:MAG: hypothetical protein ACM3X5_10180, partial [Bacillota bacterium]
RCRRTPMSLHGHLSLACRMFTGARGILVYRYSSWDDSEQTEKESKDYATLETIKSLGKPIYHSAKRVPAADVIDGFYTPTREEP